MLKIYNVRFYLYKLLIFSFRKYKNDMETEHYILGYGSLIEKESRLRTTPNAEKVIPAIAHGFQRGWFARTETNTLSTTFLGCIEDANSSVNGVLYKVSEKELTALDEREKGYVRKSIDRSQIDILAPVNKADQCIWIYLNKFDNLEQLTKNLPSADFPIVQSYVDICINGCLEIENEFKEAKEKEFAKFFIRSTIFWNASWVNDRIFPRRPFIYRPNADTIDFLLKENLADKTLFSRIYFE